MKKAILLLAMAISCTGLLAQPRIQHIGTDSEFVQHSVAKYSTDEYVVTGTITPGVISGSSDILVLMADHAGNVLWEKYVDYGMDEFVGAVIVDSRKNIVLTGYTGTNNTGNKDLIIVALDGNGNYVFDIVIEDGGMNNFGMYGLDIVETNGDQMEYLVVGTGVDNATMTSNKYAFVLKYIPDSGVQWGRIYQSTGLGVTTNFDSFNHILKVDDHPLYGEVYLLTGSGMEDSNYTQMMTNDLIDPYNNGLSVWNLANAQGHREPDLAFNNFGVMSLYKQSTNKFYVMYYGMENVPSVMEMDGNTGSGSNLVSFYPWQGHFDYQNNMVNGMVWSNEDQDEIVFSGYHLQPTTPPGIGFPFLARYGLTTNSLWNEYPTPFDGARYANLTFDFIVRPINHANPTHPEMLNQIYYRPKALVPRSVDTDYVFAEPWQDENTGTFGLALLQTGQEGEMECSVTIDGLDEGATLSSFNNFVSSAYQFERAQATIQVVNADLTNDQICVDLPKPFVRPNENTPRMGIQIYPNPTNDFLSLSGLSGMENAEIVLYDLQGQIVLSQTFKKPTNTQQLDVSTLESGVYFVKASEGGEVVFVERMIKE